MNQHSQASRRLQVASGDYGFHNKTEDWLANGHRGSSSYGAPVALGRVLPRPGGASLLR